MSYSRIFVGLMIMFFIGCSENNPVETSIEPTPLKDVSGKYVLVYFTPNETMSGSIEIVRSGDELTGKLEMQSVRYELVGVAFSDTLYIAGCFLNPWGYALTLKHRGEYELFGEMTTLLQIGPTRTSMGQYSCLAIRK